MKKLLLFFIKSLFITFLIFNLAQAQTWKITGQIVDGYTGEPLPFVNVLNVGTTVGAATDIEGTFIIIGILPGVYSIRASAIGYTLVTVENVQVSIDLTSEVNFELFETTVELGEEVVVATRPLVTRDLTSTTAIIGSDEIKVLPVTEFQEVLQLKTGIVGGSVRGGRSGEVVYAIDVILL